MFSGELFLLRGPALWRAYQDVEGLMAPCGYVSFFLYSNQGMLRSLKITVWRAIWVTAEMAQLEYSPSASWVWCATLLVVAQTWFTVLD